MTPITITTHQPLVITLFSTFLYINEKLRGGWVIWNNIFLVWLSKNRQNDLLTPGGKYCI